MFCIKCGTKLDDSAVFCFNCGNKVRVESVTVDSVSELAKKVETEQVKEVEEVNIAQKNEEKVSDINDISTENNVEQTCVGGLSDELKGGAQAGIENVNQSVRYHQPSFADKTYEQPVQPDFYQNAPVNIQKNKTGNAVKSKVATVIFAVLSVFASIMVAISSFIDGELGIGFENIGFAVAAVLIAIFAFSKSYVTSALKGAGLVIVVVLHAIFFGVSGIQASFDIFKGASAGIDYFYATLLLAGLVCFYIYMLINIIRAFINAKNVSATMLLFGYISALMMVATFIIDWVSDINGLFAFGFIPVDAGLIFLIVSDIFASIARTKK